MYAMQRTRLKGKQRRVFHVTARQYAKLPQIMAKKRQFAATLDPLLYGVSYTSSHRGSDGAVILSVLMLSGQVGEAAE